MKGQFFQRWKDWMCRHVKKRRPPSPRHSERSEEPLIAATISAEDQRFRSHCGVDPWALARAVRSVAQAGHAQSGASTITQQLVKLANPGPRTMRQKVSEMWLALRVERSWSKDRILE